MVSVTQGSNTGYYMIEFENRLTTALSQCAPGFSNQNQKVHENFHFDNAGIYKTDHN